MALQRVPESQTRKPFLVLELRYHVDGPVAGWLLHIHHRRVDHVDAGTPQSGPSQRKKHQARD